MAKRANRAKTLAMVSRKARVFASPEEEQSLGGSTQPASAPKRKVRAAVAVASQIKRRPSNHNSVIKLNEHRQRQTILAVSKDRNNIRVEFPQPNGKSIVIDLSFLCVAAKLAEPLAEGFRIYGVGKRVKTIRGRQSELRTGFLAFLIEKKLLHIGIDDIDRTVWNQFKQWLDTRKDPKSAKPIHPKTRSLTFGALSAILSALKSAPEFGKSARIAFDARPRLTWDYVETRTTPRARLSIEDLESIDTAAMDEIVALRERVEKNEAIFEEGRKKLSKGDLDLFYIPTCVAYIAENYPNGMPSVGTLYRSDRILHRAVTPHRFGKKAHGVSQLKEILYACARDLVPLVVFFAIESSLNPTTIFELEWSDVGRGEILGEAVIRLGGTKWRAYEDPSLPIPASRVEPVLDLISRLTKRSRSTAPENLKDRLFIFNRTHGAASARALGTDDSGFLQSDVHWDKCLKKFCADHHLPAFTLSQIRATIGDEVALREGIVVSSQVLAHRDINTTEMHYVSDGTRWREAEYLGKILLFMERWFDTSGKIDPRRSRLTPRMDRGAATPGFFCFDPFDSPWPVQRKGRLCKAYGQCPSCPLAAADIYDPIAVALYLALRKAIVDAQVKIAAQAWLKRFGQVLVDIDGLLKHVPTKVMNAASRFQVKLPSVE